MKLRIINLFTKFVYFALVVFIPIWTINYEYAWYDELKSEYSIVNILNGIQNIYSETVMFILILFIVLFTMLIFEFIAFDLENKGKDYKVFKNFSLWIIVISASFFLGATFIAPETYGSLDVTGYGYIHFILGLGTIIFDRIVMSRKLK